MRLASACLPSRYTLDLNCVLNRVSTSDDEPDTTMNDQPNREQQSPINLTNPIYADFGKDGLEIKWKRSILGKASEKAHGVIEFDSDDRQFVVLNRRKFHLVQFHFHHPSEHWVTEFSKPLSCT